MTMTHDLPPPPDGYADRVPFVEEASDLVDVGPDYLGRDAFLTPGAASAWAAMRDAAQGEGIGLVMVSTFRSVARQAELVAAKLERGMSLEQALEYSAYPGFSEHHSGNAIDIGSDECRHLEEEFETTAAFDWLMRNAEKFGFALSYPRGNPHGIAYEPWHWCFHPASA
ncbi:MAG: M15 family metallopeptidase [Akkermansiaceae bacterium]|nr:M15 family metallopeptidase [Akkermansiaceae bacterium]